MKTPQNNNSFQPTRGEVAKRPTIIIAFPEDKHLAEQLVTARGLRNYKVVTPGEIDPQVRGYSADALIVIGDAGNDGTISHEELTTLRACFKDSKSISAEVATSWIDYKQGNAHATL
ncbi:hypothetical protein ACMXZU_04580 [Corynebacterium striatum]